MHRPSGDDSTSRCQAIPKVCLAVLLLGIGLVLCIGTSQAAGGTGTIGGRVTYVGGLAGDHPMYVCLCGGDPDPDCRLPSEHDGAYRFDDLPDGDYTVKALVNVYTDDTSDWGDAVEAWYDPDADGQPDTVTVAGGYVWRIDIRVGGPWIPLNGPTVDGGRVEALGVDAQNPQMVYAVVREANSSGNGRVFKSTDAGASWSVVYTPSVRFYDLAARGDKVCLVSHQNYDSRLECSDDAGGTWRELGAIAPGFVVTALDLVISSEVSSTLLLAGRAVTITDGSDIDLTYGVPAVMRSTDGGDSWERVYERPSHEGGTPAFYAIVEDPSTPGTFFVGGDDAWYEGPFPGTSGPAGSIYRVENGDWISATQVYTATSPDPLLALAIDPIDGDVILAGTLLSVLRSGDGGDTWEEVLQAGAEFVAISTTGDAYAMTPNDRLLYTSDDGGLSWGSGLAVDGCCGKLAAGASLYAGGCTDGVLRSADGGATWAPSGVGISSLVSARRLAVDPFDRDRLYAAADASGGWRSADGGATWTLDLDGYVSAYASHPWKKGVVYRGITSNEQGTLERSIDGGEHWEVVYTSTVAHSDNTPFEAAIMAIAPAPSWPYTVYAGGYDSLSAPNATERQAVIVRSTGDGVAGSWFERRRMPKGSWVQALAVHPTNPDIAYAGGTWESYQGFMERTLDGGATWSLVFTDTRAVRSITIDRLDPLTVYVGTMAERIFRSEDGGDTWSAVRLPASEGGGASGALVVADPRAPRRIYLAGQGTVLESADRGDTWAEQYGALAPAPQQYPKSLTVVSRGDLQTFYFGGEGLWSFTRMNPWPESSLFLPTFLGPPS